MKRNLRSRNTEGLGNGLVCNNDRRIGFVNEAKKVPQDRPSVVNKPVCIIYLRI